MKIAENVDQFIGSYSPEIQEKLVKIREIIRITAPEATETISYGMPAYKLNGPLVYFGVGKSHIGFYPTPSGVEHFREDLAGYKFSKGAIQFPNNKPIPFDLIEKIVRYRITENLLKVK
jgi:uncharacterized protein YdhG (YjbR/CyaY superfamily)